MYACMPISMSFICTFSMYICMFMYVCLYAFLLVGIMCVFLDVHVCEYKVGLQLNFMQVSTITIIVTIFV